MEEQSKTFGSASMPFKSSDPGQPDLVVKNDDEQTNSASLTCAVVTVHEADGQRDQTNPTAKETKAPTSPTPGVRAPLAASISNIGKAVSKPSPKKTDAPKSPMTPRRFLNFVAGLFIAGMAGNFSNGFITAGIERAFPPQYVKDFHQAQSLPERDQAFSGMHKALDDGQVIEPNSRRFTNLTASLARDLDDNARYLAAKAEWARAAIPSDVAAPDFRERKRSYLIKEAESEHLALASQMKFGVEQGLIDEVERAGDVFKKSEVVFHGSRAYDAFVAAGSLAADANDFDRARKDFDQAQMIANTQWQDGGTRQSLLESRWRAELQEILANTAALKNKPNLHGQYATGKLSLANRQAMENYLDSHQFDKIDYMFEQAQKKHLQGIEGDTVVSEMYAALGKYSESVENKNFRNEALANWAGSTNSARPWVALSYWFNAKADATASSFRNDEISSIARSKGFEDLYEAAMDLRRALQRNPQVASEPAFIKAIQTNLTIADRLSNWSLPQAKLMADLHANNIAITTDEAQFFLDEISYDASHNPQTPEFMKHLLKRAADQANKIGGDAGDEFYARAVSRSGAMSTMEFVDQARFLKGRALLVQKFGTSKS